MSMWRAVGLVLVFAVLLGCGSSSGNGTSTSIFLDQVLHFDGIDDVVTIPLPPNFTFAGGLTFEAWIRPATQASSNRGIIGEAGTSLLGMQGGSLGVLSLTVSVPATSTVFSSQGLLQTGVWQHVAGTFDGTNLRLYWNGIPVATAPHSGTPSPIPNLYIGNIPPGDPDPFDGEIDEVRIWRGARTQADILAGMDTAVAANAPNLLAYYRFEESGQVVTDTSANGAHGGLGTNPGSADAQDPARIPPP